MPSMKWTVEPVFISRKPIPPDKRRINELECNNNNTLVGVIRQLASLVKISDHIFGELSDECIKLCDRTVLLRTKVDSCYAIVSKLNPKTVKVPVGDLNAFIKIEKHFKSQYDPTAKDNDYQNLFTPASRPQSIKDAYNSAAQTPLHLIRAIDSYRDDGRVGSRLFICQPVFADAKKRVNFIDIETRRPSSLVLARELPREVIISGAKKPLCNRHHVSLKDDHTAKCNSDGDQSDSTITNGQIYGLPSPEEQMQVISQEFPSKYIPIDVSGLAFHRMSNLRRSLIHTDFLIRRKKSPSKNRKSRRRNTICESVNEFNTDGRRGRLRRRSVGSIDFVHTSSQTEPNERDIYNSGRIVTVGNKMETNNNDNGHASNMIKLKAEVHHYESRSLDNLIDSEGAAQRSVAVGDECIEDELRQEVIPLHSNAITGANNRVIEAERCKDVSSLPNFSVKMRDNIPAKCVGDDGRSSSGNWSASSSTHASVDSDNIGRNDGLVNGHHIKSTLPHSRSNSSLGKDSVISESVQTTPVPGDSDERASNTCDYLNGYLSDTSGFNCDTIQTKPKMRIESGNVKIRGENNGTSNEGKIQYANRDSESWLQYFDHDSSDNTITPTESETTLNKDNCHINGNSTQSSRRSSFSLTSASGQLNNSSIIDEEEAESVYSVDTDGYYTSMHTDSGLFRLPVKLMITPNSSFRSKSKRDSIASVATVGDLSINSILSQTETESSTTTLTNQSSRTSSRGKLPPPPPPPRISSMLKSLRSANESANRLSLNSTGKCDSSSLASTSSRSHSPSPPGTTASESENNSYKRLKMKTAIDSSRYPSMCAVTSTEGSEDGKSGDSSSNDGSSRATPTGRLFRSSYRAFRIKDIFGFGKESGRNTPVVKEEPTPAPTVASIRRPQSPFRFKVYGESAKMKQFRAERPTGGNLHAPNIVRPNAVSSFSSEPDTGDDSNINDNEPLNEKECSAIEPSPIIFNERASLSLSDHLNDDNCYANNNVPLPSSEQTLTLTSTPTHEPKVPSTMLFPISRRVSPPEPPPKPKFTFNNNCQSSSTAIRPNSLTLPNTSSSTVPTATITKFPISSSAHRSVARVTLDAHGKVIYTSNSLGRRRDGHPMNYVQQLQQIQEPVNIESQQRSATLPIANKPRVSSPLSPINKPGAFVRLNQNGLIECIGNNLKHQQMSQPLLTQTPNANISAFTFGYNSELTTPAGGKSAPSSRCTTPIVGQHQVKRSITPAAPKSGGTFFQITAQQKQESGTNNSKKSYMESDLNDFTPFSTSSPLSPDTNGGGHSPSGNSNSSGGSGSSQNSPSSFNRNGRGRLSTNDLLILIHNSKKKHNIKTEPEIISNPNSPSFVRSNSSGSGSSLSPNGNGNSKQILSCPSTPSHGQITTPTSSANAIPDRRSWSGSDSNFTSQLPNGQSLGQPGLGQPGCRRSLASDRLGPTKPTTMNDFKRLLLNTRIDNGTTDRLSAAELLRANNKRPPTPMINSTTSFVGRSTPVPKVAQQLNRDVNGPPPQIVNGGTICAQTTNLVKPRIINGRGRMTCRNERLYETIEEEKDSNHNERKLMTAQTVNNYYKFNSNYGALKTLQSKLNSPQSVANNYNRVSPNPNSTSTWV